MQGQIGVRDSYNHLKIHQQQSYRGGRSQLKGDGRCCQDGERGWWGSSRLLPGCQLVDKIESAFELCDIFHLVYVPSSPHSFYFLQTTNPI
jgi:hypothetical protein